MSLADRTHTKVCLPLSQRWGDNRKGSRSGRNSSSIKRAAAVEGAIVAVEGTVAAIKGREAAVEGAVAAIEGAVVAVKETVASVAKGVIKRTKKTRDWCT